MIHDAALLVDAVVAYAVHEHRLGHARRIDVRVLPQRVVVEDDGRGMGLERPGYVAGLFGTLAGGDADVQLHGIGLSLVAASVARLEVDSWREGARWTQAFDRGVASGPPTSAPDGGGKGTRMALSPVSWSAEDVQRLSDRVEHWRRRHPTLAIGLHVEAGAIDASRDPA